jgi:hypothetical protein
MDAARNRPHLPKPLASAKLCYPPDDALWTDTSPLTLGLVSCGMTTATDPTVTDRFEERDTDAGH